MGFVHLHCHTEYSLLDGAIRLKDLCMRACEFKMEAVTITDHGNLFGALDFYLKAREAGLKPIIGCEVYVAPGDRKQRTGHSASEVGYHLVLLAQNNVGYHNLIKLVSLGYLEGFYYKPRVDMELLQRYNEGLIALSACLKGEVPSALIEGNIQKAEEVAQRYVSIFPQRFYLELMSNGLKEQEELNHRLVEFSKRTNLPLVATNDCHYLNKEDAYAHEILLCIQTNSKITDPKRMHFKSQELYFKSPEEMERDFSHIPQALENVEAIARECSVEIELGKHHFPLYKVPEGISLEEEFTRLAKEGLKKRLETMPYKVEEEKYWKRLNHEIKIICQKGFAGYFLIVQDFINWAKSQGIPVGPGRGSAAGALTAYALRITNLDPIKYNLLFERFLNAERESLPDIDVDFCYNRREEVIRYVTEKYGKNNVAQITTFGTMKAKAAVRDVGRALGMSYQETDRIAKLIPDEPNISIEKAIEMEPGLKKLMEKDEKVKELIEISKKLEGLARHASTHAAGIVISDKPMMEYLPLYTGKRGEIVTQFDMKKVEKVGLIKFDFLGLKTLTVLDDAVKLAKKNNKKVPPLDELPLTDKKTFELLCRGQSDGVFQLESSGMRKVLVELKPSCFEDLIALLALYRPGPLDSGMVQDFIARKHKRVEIEYPHPKLEPILKETYGVILYQEQVMRIASELANYTLGDGDILRRAMGKKIPEAMAKQRNKFLEGARANGIPENVANHIFDLMEKFAGYGFNKSHSAAYALISYQTAYIKAHYPVEFMAALLTSEVNNTDKVIAHINACKEMGIRVLRPDINKSMEYFSVEGENILFGLCGIKNVGIGAVKEILKERERNGPYRSIMDFCKRLPSRKITKRVVESLIKSGAFDGFGYSRRGMLESLDKIFSYVQKREKNKRIGELSLFEAIGGNTREKQEEITIEELNLEEWAEDTKLKFEKETLGFYVTGHPLLKYKNKMKLLRVVSIKQCYDMDAGSDILLALIVTSKKEKILKRGDKMAFCGVEDLSGVGEMVLFPSLYEKIKQYLEPDVPLLCRVKTDVKEIENQEDGSKFKQVTLVAKEISLLKDSKVPEDEPYFLEIDAEKIQNNISLKRLKEILKRHPGPNPVHLKILLPESICELQLGPGFAILPTEDMEMEISKWKEEVI